MYLIHFCLNSMGREYWIFGDSVLILKTQAGLSAQGKNPTLIIKAWGIIKSWFNYLKIWMLWYLLKRCDVEEMKKENRDVREWYSSLIRLAEGK